MNVLRPQPIALLQAQRAAGAAPAAITPSGRPGLPERAPQASSHSTGVWSSQPSSPTYDTRLVVSNEVGLGLVPPYPLGRRYRDLLGLVNQRVAARADRVYLLVAGLPLELKAPHR